jgi:hypothetical protein
MCYVKKKFVHSEKWQKNRTHTPPWLKNDPPPFFNVGVFTMQKLQLKHYFQRQPQRTRLPKGGLYLLYALEFSCAGTCNLCSTTPTQAQLLFPCRSLTSKNKNDGGCGHCDLKKTEVLSFLNRLYWLSLYTSIYLLLYISFNDINVLNKYINIINKIYIGRLGNSGVFGVNVIIAGIITQGHSTSAACGSCGVGEAGFRLFGKMPAYPKAYWYAFGVAGPTDLIID